MTASELSLVPRDDERRFRTYVLGAGFSALAGLPLAPELWREVLRRIDRLEGQDNRVRRDLARFLRFMRLTTGIAIGENDVDYEEFLGFLDIEHYLSFKGSDTWSEAGNETQLLIRWLIGQTLFERQMEGRSRRPDAYRRFAAGLRGSDYILTFNYDTLVEEALEAVGRPYRLFPSRLDDVGVLISTVDSSRDDVETVVLKLHGSIDWFDRQGYDRSVAVNNELADPARPNADVYQRFPPRHPVFGRDNIVTATPILEGPQQPDDALHRIWRVTDPSALYTNDGYGWALLGGSPFLLTPSKQKLLYSSTLAEFWSGINRSGAGLGLGVIGFSLPSHDAHALQALFSLMRNYTEHAYDESWFGWQKLPLRLVDLQPSEQARQAYRERFRFVNWDRTETYFDGFSDEAVEFLFRETRGGYQPRQASESDRSAGDAAAPK